MADFQLMPMQWLGQPADPGGSLARGVRTGAEVTDTFLRSRMMGLQHEAQRLRNMLTFQQIEAIENDLKQRQGNTEAFSELQKHVSSSISSGNTTPESFNHALGIIARHPTLGDEPRTQSLLETFGKSLAIRQEQEKLRRQSLPPDVFELPGGERAVRVGPQSFQILAAPDEQLTPEQLRERAAKFNLEASEMDESGKLKFTQPDPATPLSTIGKLQADRDAAFAAKDMGKVEEINEEIKQRFRTGRAGSTVTAQDYESLKQAVAERDTQQIQVFKNKLGLNDADKAAFDAKLSIITSPLSALTPEATNKAIDALVEEFKAKQGIAAPANPVDPLGLFE